MIVTPAAQPTHNLADQAARSADMAIRSTQRVANDSLDKLADAVQDLRQQASPMLDSASAQANALAKRSVDALLDGSHRLRDQARRASDSTVNYIKDEPVKAVLIAAAAGAALTALLGLLSRLRDRG